jgi:putative zinc finger protein
MADILCGYTADRDETLVAYLYGEIDPAQRSAFEAHIATCDRCRHELVEMQGLRDQLQDWKVPETRPIGRDLHNETLEAASSRRISSWKLHEVPAWAQVAAALLVLGVSAGIANLTVRYDNNGLTVRTGWSRTPTEGPVDASKAPERPRADANASAAPWRADLAALETRLKTEFHALPERALPSPRTAISSPDSELLQQVRALLRESERKQQNELALRIAEVIREFDSRRGTDLVNINQTLRAMQSNTGIEVLKQREALSRLDYLVRTSGQQR